LNRKEEKVWQTNKKLKKLKEFFNKMHTKQKLESNNFLMLWKHKEERVCLMRKGLKIYREL
jgi:hypothetical protein